MNEILLEEGDYIIRKKGEYYLSNALFGHANIEVEKKDAERLIFSRKVIKQRSSGFGVTKYTQPPQQQPMQTQSVKDGADEFRSLAKEFGATNLIQEKIPEEEWYYHPSRLNDCVYSSEGHRDDKEYFDSLIDSGKAVMVKQADIALYPNNPKKYECGIYLKRWATVTEMQSHLTNLQRQLMACPAPHTKYLSGEEHISRTYLKKRIATTKATILYLSSVVVTTQTHQHLSRKAA